MMFDSCVVALVVPLFCCEVVLVALFVMASAGGWAAACVCLACSSMMVCTGGLESGVVDCLVILGGTDPGCCSWDWNIPWP